MRVRRRVRRIASRTNRRRVRRMASRTNRRRVMGMASRKNRRRARRRFRGGGEQEEGQEEGQQDGQYKCQEEGQGIANMRAINLLLAGAIYTVL